jgi:alginate O-acetyltransferase complex protein AlgI
MMDSTGAWLAVLAYAIQIYFDFSAYSDMALGLARVFNFHFPENFAGPYRARSATEFWKRWHMTLSRWFRDYVYIPFGGNRHGKGREYAGLLLTFFLTSLWHGAFWHFLVWGGLWSALLVVERVTGLRKVQGWSIPRRAFMVFFILVSWVPFRSEDMGQTLAIWGHLFDFNFGRIDPMTFMDLTPLRISALVVGAMAFLVPSFVKTRLVDFLLLRPDGAPRLFLSAVVGAVALFLGVLFSLYASFSPFLYYQF